jgi:hypothetical protein
MPGGRPYRKPVSQAQARLFGAAAGGQIPGFDPKEAQQKLKGVNEKKLPKTSKAKGKK